MIYSPSLQDRVRLRYVLEVMLTNRLYDKDSKCAYSLDKVDYLGHLIYADRVSINPTTIQAMKECPKPINVK